MHKLMLAFSIFVSLLHSMILPRFFKTRNVFQDFSSQKNAQKMLTLISKAFQGCRQAAFNHIHFLFNQTKNAKYEKYIK